MIFSTWDSRNGTDDMSFNAIFPPTSRNFSDCYDMKPEWKDLCSYDNHDLWLPFAVLGKEYYTTWINLDSPAHFDVTNIDKTWFAGFEFSAGQFHEQRAESRAIQEMADDSRPSRRPQDNSENSLGNLHQQE